MLEFKDRERYGCILAGDLKNYKNNNPLKSGEEKLLRRSFAKNEASAATRTRQIIRLQPRWGRWKGRRRREKKKLPLCSNHHPSLTKRRNQTQDQNSSRRPRTKSSNLAPQQLPQKEDQKQQARSSTLDSGMATPIVGAVVEAAATTAVEMTEEHVKRRRRRCSFGTIDSCDSLMWDNYDVEEADGNLMPPAVGESKGRPDSQVSLAESDFSYQCGLEVDGDDEDEEDEEQLRSSTASKGSSPDNLKEGRRLLREMKELRKEIKKMGDVSSMNISSPVRDLKKTSSVTSPSKMLISNDRAHDILASMTIETKILSEKKGEDQEFEDPEISMWDSGYLDQCYEPETVISALSKSAAKDPAPAEQKINEPRCESATEEKRSNEEESIICDKNASVDKDLENLVAIRDGGENNSLQRDNLQISFVQGNNEQTNSNSCPENEPQAAEEECDSALGSTGSENDNGEIANIPRTLNNENCDAESEDDDDLPGLEPVNKVEDSPPPASGHRSHNSTPVVLAEIITSGLERKLLETNPNISPLAVQRIIDGLDKKSFPDLPELNRRPPDQPILSKSQRRRRLRKKESEQKKKKAVNPSIPSSVPDRELSGFPNQTFSLPQAAAFSQTFPAPISGGNQAQQATTAILAAALGIETPEEKKHLQEVEILRKIIFDTDPKVGGSAGTQSWNRKLIYRDLFEWEVGFCENEARFRQLMHEKQMADKQCLQKALEWDIDDKTSNIVHKNPGASIMCL